ncbi:hypothetical protein ACFY6U_26820 [Streptomyces sp. NPDC013157]|uniref:hypothetical protein n=1 Tax=Streptomyces sp. NPDC013157 TaxID=3364861 RepID=UPI00368DD1D4
MNGELVIQAFGTATGIGCLARAVYEAVLAARSRRPAVRPRPGRARPLLPGRWTDGASRGRRDAAPGRQPLGAAFAWFVSCTLAFGIAAAVGLAR